MRIILFGFRVALLVRLVLTLNVFDLNVTYYKIVKKVLSLESYCLSRFNRYNSLFTRLTFLLRKDYNDLDAIVVLARISNQSKDRNRK